MRRASGRRRRLRAACLEPPRAHRAVDDPRREIARTLAYNSPWVRAPPLCRRTSISRCSSPPPSFAASQARISRMTSRLSQAASVIKSRSAIALAWRLISGETRAFKISVQRHGTQCGPKASRRLSCVAGFLTPRKSFAENTSKLFRPGTAANLRLCRDWVDQRGIIILRGVDACADFVRDH